MLSEFITSQFGTLHVFPLLVYPELQCRYEVNQGLLLTKHFNT